MLMLIDMCALFRIHSLPRLLNLSVHNPVLYPFLLGPGLHAPPAFARLIRSAASQVGKALLTYVLTASAGGGGERRTSAGGRAGCRGHAAGLSVNRRNKQSDH